MESVVNETSREANCEGTIKSIFSAHLEEIIARVFIIDRSFIRDNFKMYVFIICTASEKSENGVGWD